MAREMGGKRFAQVLAALAVAIGPVALRAGALLQYVAFDYLWWVVTAYFCGPVASGPMIPDGGWESAPPLVWAC